jgi:hypothetical protein
MLQQHPSVRNLENRHLVSHTLVQPEYSQARPGVAQAEDRGSAAASSAKSQSDAAERWDALRVLRGQRKLQQVGVGLILAEKSDGLTVTGVLPSGAADRDGRIKTGDVVAHIDGHSVQRIQAAKPLMLGDVGTYVDIGVVRGGELVLLRVLRPDESGDGPMSPETSFQSTKKERLLASPMERESPPTSPGEASEELPNSDILVELRSARLQVRRLQKDVQVLRQQLNEAEADREGLSTGLRTAAQRQVNALDFSRRAMILLRVARAWNLFASRRRKSLEFAGCLARKAGLRCASVALSAWRMEATLNAQQASCEVLVATERARGNNLCALNYLRRNLVRRLCALIRG